MLSVRPAASGDVPAVAALADAAYRDYVPRIGRQPAPMTADYAEAVRGARVWVADEDGVIVGFAVLVAKRDHLLLDTIAVAPAAQGRGVGNHLMAFTEDRARQLGVSEVRLYTNEAMTENLAYYPRRGYRETHRARQDGFQRVFFRKVIG